jgi:hypothetical protein
MSIYSFKRQESISNYGSIKEFLESEYGMTNNLYDRDQWDDFYGTGKSKPSNETQPIVSSLERMTTKYNPKHYQRGSIQVWDFVVDQQLDFLAGNIIKYICRAGYKDQETEIDDWLKIRAYVNRKIQALSDNENT